MNQARHLPVVQVFRMQVGKRRSRKAPQESYQSEDGDTPSHLFLTLARRGEKVKLHERSSTSGAVRMPAKPNVFRKTCLGGGHIKPTRCFQISSRLIIHEKQSAVLGASLRSLLRSIVSPNP